MNEFRANRRTGTETAFVTGSQTDGQTNVFHMLPFLGRERKVNFNCVDDDQPLMRSKHVWQGLRRQSWFVCARAPYGR